MRKINPDSYQPLGYRVLVRDEKIEEKTAGGVILPDESKKHDEFSQQFGHVIRLGKFAFSMETQTGRVIDENAPAPGDLVNYAKYAGGTFQTDNDGHKYRIINDDDIIGVVERKK